MNIDNNVVLANLDGLSNLTSIGVSLNILRNTALTNLSGLSNLTSIGYGLTISYNPSLESLFGFSDFVFVGVGGVSISNNTALNFCCEAQCLVGSSLGLVSVRNNAFGCNSFSEIENACSIGNCISPMTMSPIGVIERFNHFIKLFPNPASNSIYLQLNTEGNEKLSYDIMDIVGQIVAKGKLDNQGYGVFSYEIDIQGLVAGVYEFTLNIDGVKKETRKLVVEK